ncbi:hypothetical protein BHM03_00056975 [Ensete ventricosum]|nr:hypothetical protein BHM03_00056975 [Ensete ventricosum]
MGQRNAQLLQRRIVEGEITAGHVHFDAGRDQGSCQRKIAASSVSGSLLAAIKEDGSERLLLAALCNERCVLRLKG